MARVAVDVGGRDAVEDAGFEAVAKGGEVEPVLISLSLLLFCGKYPGESPKWPKSDSQSLKRFQFLI